MPRKDIERGHQHARSVMNNPKLKDVMVELDENPDALAEAKRDPAGFLKKRGVDLPGDPRVTIEEGSIRIGLCWGEWCIWFEF